MASKARHWLKRQNAFALVGQGFVLGGLLFFVTHAESFAASRDAAPPAAIVQPAR